MKRAIVIGATSGIGRGLAEELAARGYRVGLVGRREALLREIAAADPAAYSCAVADVTQPDAALAALDGLVAVLDGLELCIVAAGTGDLNPDLDFTVEASAIRTNILGWTAVVDWACRLFERQRGGHLVVISSVGGLRGSGAAPAYNALKPIRSTMPRGCASGSRRADCRSRSPTYGRGWSIRRWPKARGCSGCSRWRRPSGRFCVPSRGGVTWLSSRGAGASRRGCCGICPKASI